MTNLWRGIVDGTPDDELSRLSYRQAMDSPRLTRTVHEGALAEFGALRQEIDSRASRQHGLFALHITTSGAVFGFALSAPGRVSLLLILPITTYLFCARYMVEDNAIRTIGQYIQDELRGRVRGGLRWEQWQQTQAGHLPAALEWAHPSFVTLPGVACAALAWTVPVVLSEWEATPILSKSVLLFVWLTGFVAALVSFGLVFDIHYTFRVGRQGGFLLVQDRLRRRGHTTGPPPRFLLHRYGLIAAGGKAEAAVANRPTGGDPLTAEQVQKRIGAELIGAAFVPAALAAFAIASSRSITAATLCGASS